MHDIANLFGMIINRKRFGSYIKCLFSNPINHSIQMEISGKNNYCKLEMVLVDCGSRTVIIICDICAKSDD